jgi:hypothetical protein
VKNSYRYCPLGPQATHPSINSNENPPEHTIIIEADITRSVAKNTHQKIDEHLRQQIIKTCGDAGVMMVMEHIHPVLCIYIGGYLICIDNKQLKGKVPRGNGKMCRVIGIKLKQDPQNYKWKNYYGEKVRTVNTSDIEWVECEHINKTGTILQLET